MRLHAIAAMSLNRVIGAGNQIPWHLPEDFRWFKQITLGHVLVMGRKTFQSIGRPLPGRDTFVLTRGDFAHPGVQTLHDLNELLAWLKNPTSSLSPTLSSIRNGGEGRGEEALGFMERDAARGALSQRKVFICGGAQIYEQALPLCDELYLTLVKREVAGDAFFPPFEAQFELAEELRDTPEFSIRHYRRKPQQPANPET